MTNHRGMGGQRPTIASVRLQSLHLSGTPILGEISLDLQRGETVALTGRSGIGKTTLLRVLAGLQSGYSGEVATPANIAMVFQEPTLLPWRRVIANLTVTTGIDAAQAETWLSAVGLSGRGHDFPGQLSLGQQRRLALARAFAIAPDLLLMDEPFVSLDAKTAAEIMSLFQKLRAQHQVTTVLVTHAMCEARALATRILEFDGPPARVVTDRPNEPA